MQHSFTVECDSSGSYYSTFHLYKNNICCTNFWIYIFSPSVHTFYLQEIVNNQSDYLTSNTVLKLVPGVYHIHRKLNLHITNVTSLVLKTSSDSTKVEIRCSQNATFKISLINCSSSAIKDITFSHSAYTLHVLHCSNMSLSNTVFIRNKGAILIRNSDI